MKHTAKIVEVVLLYAASAAIAVARRAAGIALSRVGVAAR